MFVSFEEISKIPFKQVLDHYNQTYQETETELRNDTIIVSKAKNLFTYRKGGKGGSIINWLSDHKSIGLRHAALELKKNFQTPNAEPKRDIPELELHPTDLVTPEMAKNYEIGLVKQKSIMAGRVAFRVYDSDGKSIGYVGLKDGQWFYPKGFEASKHLYNYNRRNGNTVCTLLSSPLEAVAHHQKTGDPRVIALFSQSVSDEQIELLKVFKHILLIHPKPENILYRLARICYVHLK